MRRSGRGYRGDRRRRRSRDRCRRRWRRSHRARRCCGRSRDRWRDWRRSRPFRGRRDDDRTCCGRGRDRCCRRSLCRGHNRRGCGLSGRRHNRRLRRNRRRGGPRRRHSRSFLFLRDRPQNITGTGDVRQINLGFDFFFAAQRARGTRRGTRRFGRAADIDPDLLCFMLLQRTGMRFFLGYAHMR